MVATRNSGSDRRRAIAESGIRILARDGMRALTHRAVDREAGIAQGSSSYYAPTRRALLELIVQNLVERSAEDAKGLVGHDTATPPGGIGVRTGPGAGPGAGPDAGPGADSDIDGMARMVAALIDALASRGDDMRARYALLLELDADDPLREVLARRSPVQEGVRSLAISALAQIGVRSAEDRASELFDLTDALLVRRIVAGAELPVESIVAAYLRGIADGG
ncbi:AcrR family transcriptional regulator [Microbacterium resistens]|uniref:AcrR family transcriptional regulator n=1 Tax=Microbacterium resistens TaxID=156977 RepID=A0ABU1SEH1_9MICO|nr:hypothetical protein [Microbacterium resistens]MDR6868003.1 AcrR family transcriptional regulator [Microbacterium resistens]